MTGVEYEGGYLVFRLLCWIAFGLAGGYIFARKGYSPTHGVIVGALFGPCALFVSALCPRTAAALEEDDEANRLKRELVVARAQKPCPKCGCTHSVINQFCPRCMHRYSSSHESVAINPKELTGHSVSTITLATNDGSVIQCLKCGRWVVPKSNGHCPSCQAQIAEAKTIDAG